MNVLGQAVAQINMSFHPAGSYFRSGHEGEQSFFEDLTERKKSPSWSSLGERPPTRPK